jgi:lipoyl-dependent peroxiredoxin
MPDKVLYTAEATSTGDGRNGHVATSDGRIDLDLAFPPEMGGTGAGSNPEQLFAAGYAACFHSALRLVAGRGHAALGDSTVTAQVGIGPEGDAFGLLVTLVIHVPGMERDKVREFADAAHQVCPYSRATKGNVSVELRVLLRDTPPYSPAALPRRTSPGGRPPVPPGCAAARHWPVHCCSPRWPLMWRPLYRRLCCGAALASALL